MEKLKSFANSESVKAMPSGKKADGKTDVAHKGIKNFMKKAKSFFVEAGKVMAAMAEGAMEAEMRQQQAKRQKNIEEGAMMFGDHESAAEARKKYDAIVKAKMSSLGGGPR